MTIFFIKLELFSDSLEKYIKYFHRMAKIYENNVLSFRTTEM